MRTLLSILLTINALWQLPAQSLKQYEKAADQAFEKKDYNAAISHLAKVLEKDPKNWDALYKYAECARLFYAYPIAEKSFNKIAESKRRKDFPLIDFRLAEVKKSTGDYAAAKVFFKKYLADSPAPDEAFVQRAKSEIETCDWALQRLAAAEKTEVSPLGREVNSTYSDFAPVLRGDTLWFSSYRFELEKSNKKPKPRTTKILQSVGSTKARQPGRGFPADDSTHVAHAVFSEISTRMYCTFCKNTGPQDIRCEIFFLEKGKKGKWSEPKLLLNAVNLKGSTATQPSLFFDRKTGREQLLFASDRPGGKGKLDIYQVALNSGDGQPIAQPVAIAAINSPENDGTPHFSAIDETIWFASEGWQGLGGWDIYSAKKDATGNFSPPQHAAPPINTSYNDLYFILKKDGKSGYLASNRPGSMFLDAANKACCNDIFTVKFPPPPPPPIAEIPKIPTGGDVKPVPPVPDAPPIPQKGGDPNPPKKLEDFAGLPLYFDNDEPDKRTRKTTTKLTYEESFWAYYEQLETYRTEFSGGLAGADADRSRAEIDDFFETEIKRGYDRLFLLTDMLLARLQDGEKVEIIIKGFTSPRAESAYNLALGRRRISSVRNHFEKYGDGVLQPYLKTGFLRVTEASFGETTAKTTISDRLEDRRGSIYNPDAARERRVEIVEIKSN